MFDTGYFSLCTPVAEETRDGIKFTLEVWGCCVRGSLLSPSSCLACQWHRVHARGAFCVGLAGCVAPRCSVMLFASPADGIQFTPEVRQPGARFVRGSLQPVFLPCLPPASSAPRGGSSSRAGCLHLRSIHLLLFLRSGWAGCLHGWAACLQGCLLQPSFALDDRIKWLHSPCCCLCCCGHAHAGPPNLIHWACRVCAGCPQPRAARLHCDGRQHAASGASSRLPLWY